MLLRFSTREKVGLNTAWNLIRRKKKEPKVPAESNRSKCENESLAATCDSNEALPGQYRFSCLVREATMHHRQPASQRNGGRASTARPFGIGRKHRALLFSDLVPNDGHPPGEKRVRWLSGIKGGSHMFQHKFFLLTIFLISSGLPIQAQTPGSAITY